MSIEITEDALMSAINTGEILTIIYHGGSKPGASRQIQPRSIYDDEVRALDVGSGRNKQFLIRQIQIADEHTPQPEYVPDIYHRGATVEELIHHHCLEAEKIGWVVKSTEDSIELFSHFKNGKTRKTPTVSIDYQEFTYQIDIDFETNEQIEIKKKSSRPWHIDGRSFKHPQKAFEKFLKLAIEKAPGVAGD